MEAEPNKTALPSSSTSSTDTRDTRRAKRLVPALVTLAIVLGGIGYLFASSAGEAFEYYKHVDEIAPCSR